jgi:hypothetical protein
MAINFANNVRTRLHQVALAAHTTLKVTLDTSGAYQAPFDPTPGKVFLRIIDRDNNPQRLEFISYAGVSLSGGIYTLTGVLRGLGGTTARNWRGGVILENYFDADTLNNLIIDNATEDTAGIVQFADVPETIAGLIDDKAVHPAGLKAVIDALPAGGGGYPKHYINETVTVPANSSYITALPIICGENGALIFENNAIARVLY